MRSLFKRNRWRPIGSFTYAAPCAVELTDGKAVYRVWVEPFMGLLPTAAIAWGEERVASLTQARVVAA